VIYPYNDWVKTFLSLSNEFQKPAPLKKTKTLVITKERDASSVELGNPWQVVLFNDEVHSFDEVIIQIRKATGYPVERAANITFRVHKNGKAIVYIGDLAACEKVAAILGQIKLTISLEKT
jgi:ATP-dependent Clp protease adaptor protein ClpS